MFQALKIAIISLTLPLLPLSADELVQVSSVRIQYGNMDNQIGLVEDGGHWKPLFFCVDAEGNVHVPDVYKSRIAVFGKDDKLKASKPCPAGISPRMNYFGMNPRGMYCAFGDGQLSLITKYGRLSWQYNFGYGIIPSWIVPSNSALFLVLPTDLDKDGRAIVFDYGLGTPIGRSGSKKEDRIIPLFTWGEMTFTPWLKDMRALKGWKGKYNGSQGGVWFVYADKDGNSLWSEKTETGETIYLFSKAGDLVSKGYIAFQGDMPATGFWTVADSSLTVYKNYFFKDRMLVVGYKFKK
jgi:hypothetical protein